LEAPVWTGPLLPVMPARKYCAAHFYGLSNPRYLVGATREHKTAWGCCFAAAEVIASIPITRAVHCEFSASLRKRCVGREWHTDQVGRLARHR